MIDVEVAPRTRDRHIEQPPLLLDIFTLAVRDVAIVTRRDHNHLPLQSLGAVDGANGEQVAAHGRLLGHLLFGKLLEIDQILLERAMRFGFFDKLLDILRLVHPRFRTRAKSLQIGAIAQPLL